MEVLLADFLKVVPIKSPEEILEQNEMRCTKGEKSIEWTNGKPRKSLYAGQWDRPYYFFTLGEIYIINDFVYIVPAFPCLVNLSTDEKESRA